VELTTLRQFVAIAKAGSLTEAARTLGVGQPALSVMLRKLDAEVGTQLTHRTRRGIELSSAGRVFLSHALESLRQAQQGVAAVRELVGLKAGSLRIGGGATAITYILPPAVSTFRREHPGVRFFVREAGSSAVAAAVASGELDLGIVTLPITRADEERLLTTPLATDDLRLIVPDDHALARRRSFAWQDLADQPVVAFEQGSAVRELIDRHARNAGVELTVVMELRAIEPIKRMVAAGIGVGFVSRFALGPGVGLRCTDELARTLALVRSSQRGPSPAADAFQRALLATLPCPTPPRPSARGPRPTP
jgi:DNA-binding transcriptional LysR family regulator